MTGDTISNNHTSFYSIEFEEVHWHEESGECTNYGEGTQFKTIADCVAKEQEKIVKPLLGCQVPWMASPDDPDMCKGRLSITTENKGPFNILIRQTIKNILRQNIVNQFRACLKPCQELKAHSKLRLRKVAGTSKTVVLSFHKRVKVTRYMNSYDMFDLVVEAGSSLGLWIGLSALGVFDLLLQAGGSVMERVKKMKRTTVV